MQCYLNINRRIFEMDNLSTAFFSRTSSAFVQALNLKPDSNPTSIGSFRFNFHGSFLFLLEAEIVFSEYNSSSSEAHLSPYPCIVPAEKSQLCCKSTLTSSHDLDARVFGELAPHSRSHCENAFSWHRIPIKGSSPGDSELCICITLDSGSSGFRATTMS